MTLTNANVRVYFDDRAGCEAGWVVRWDEVDEDGHAPIGHRAMEEPIDAVDADQAVEMAADYCGVDADDVTVL